MPSPRAAEIILAVLRPEPIFLVSPLLIMFSTACTSSKSLPMVFMVPPVSLPNLAAVPGLDERRPNSFTSLYLGGSGLGGVAVAASATTALSGLAAGTLAAVGVGSDLGAGD